MKKFKSALALLLCALMLLPTLSAGLAFAVGDVYPESEHYYSNNYYNEWVYTYPKEAEGLFVTFSKKTKTERADNFYGISFKSDEGISLGDVTDLWQTRKIGDYISIFDKNNNLIDVYQGDELSGETVYIPGNTFKISLTTDSSVTAYGFSIDRISDTVPEDTVGVLYDFGNGEIKTDIFDFDYLEKYYTRYDEESEDWILTAPLSPYWCGYTTDSGAVIGWEAEDKTVYSYAVEGGAYSIHAEEKVFPVDSEKGGIYRFTAVKTPVMLQKEDVYSFTNSSEYFSVDGNGGYYMTKESYLRLVASACIIHSVGPLALPASVLSTVLIGYPQMQWNGSCIGFTSTVCLQKKGILDVVKTVNQDGAKCINDLKPTKELINLINYYNGQASLTTVTKNKANRKTPKEFSRQLKKMFESVCAGNLVLMEFMQLGGNEGLYHGFALTGGYTDENGNHVLFYYDDNDQEYGSEGICSVCYIAPDFSEIYTGDYGALETILWTDEFEGYKSIDINSKSINPSYYWKEYIKHIVEIFKEWLEFYFFGALKK